MHKYQQFQTHCFVSGPNYSKHSMWSLELKPFMCLVNCVPWLYKFQIVKFMNERSFAHKWNWLLNDQNTTDINERLFYICVHYGAFELYLRNLPFDLVVENNQCKIVHPCGVLYLCSHVFLTAQTVYYLNWNCVSYEKGW